MAALKGRSEDLIGEKVDHCLTDSLLKTGVGLGIGVVFSALLFKRRPWPIALGAGVGLGVAIGNCQSEFRHLYPVQTRIEKQIQDEN